MNDIRLEHITKKYGGNEVVSDLTLPVRPGERMILLGPSGCGKSTTLRMISGLTEITSGDLYMGGVRMNDVGCGDRNVAMVFQNYALFPHMTVYQNIAFGLRALKLPKAEAKKRVLAMIETLELSGLEKRLPRELSGGQRQRVALARAAIKNAPYFLLDEPLSNLDVQLRAHARKELVRIHELNRSTFLYVTHDQIEAMTIGQRVAILNKGKLQMVDTPHNIYYRPANVFCARFIGTPPMNVFPAELEESSLAVAGHRIRLSPAWGRRLASSLKGPRVTAGIRPEEIILRPSERENTVPATVKYVENYGNSLGVYFELGGLEMVATVGQNRPLSQGDALFAEFPDAGLSFFDPETEKNVGYPEEYGGEDKPLHPAK